MADLFDLIFGSLRSHGARLSLALQTNSRLGQGKLATRLLDTELTNVCGSMRQECMNVCSLSVCSR